jgi:exopolysaccharide production protein ExoZ
MDNPNLRKKLGLIQGFRGIASLMVLLTHGSAIFFNATGEKVLNNFFNFGYAGVDFFFVLSGFIIYYIGHRDIGQPKQLKSFIFKRFVRVYPLYWAVLMPRLLQRLWGPWSENTLATVLSSLALFPYPKPPVINVSWTLTHEVFFYFIFSLLIWRFSAWLLAGLITWLALDAIYWMAHAMGNYHELIENPVLRFLLSPVHLEFGLGMAAAHLAMHYRWKHKRWMIGVGSALFLTVGMVDNWIINQGRSAVFGGVIDQDYTSVTGRYSVLFFGLPSMLIVLGAAALEMVEQLTLPKWFIYLGDASYSIYLIHGTVIFYTIEALTKLGHTAILHNFFLRLLVMGLGLGAGCLCHEWVEKPLLSLTRRRTSLPKPE